MSDVTAQDRARLTRAPLYEKAKAAVDAWERENEYDLGMAMVALGAEIEQIAKTLALLDEIVERLPA